MINDYFTLFIFFYISAVAIVKVQTFVGDLIEPNFGDEMAIWLTFIVHFTVHYAMFKALIFGYHHLMEYIG